MPVREVESDLYYSQTSVSFRLPSPEDSPMQSTPSPFTFAEIIGLKWVLEKRQSQGLWTFSLWSLYVFKITQEFHLYMSGNLENCLREDDHHSLFPPRVVSNTRQTPPLGPWSLTTRQLSLRQLVHDFLCSPLTHLELLKDPEKIPDRFGYSFQTSGKHFSFWTSRSAVELPQEQSSPYFLACRFW